MTICSRCKKDIDPDNFLKNGKVLKTCNLCRDKKKHCKNWKDKNKERIADYNKIYREKNKKEKKVKTILIRKKGAVEYKTYYNLKECCDELGLCKPNVSKMLKGGLKSTGGYEGMYGDIVTIKPDITKTSKTWDEVKEEKKYNKKIISAKRTPHVKKDNVIGKKCCTCQEWKPLEKYNKSKSQWDKLRNDCKDCLVKYRKKNRRKIQDNMNKYEKKRKKEDPEFKLIKTLRSRLGNAMKRKNTEKSKSTLELTGCNLSFLKGYLESKFEEGMTWENHGKWHVDHIKPCCSFDFSKEEEQKKCFHYTNLQPLWAEENLVKSGKVE